MMQVDHQELEEADFPAFPVVFQQQFQTQFENSLDVLPTQSNITNINISDKDISLLLTKIQISHDTKYPQLFTQTVQNKTYAVQKFFETYRPLDQQFMKELKINLNKLNIVRLSHNKVYIGELQEKSCHGKGILIFKNGNIYEGYFQHNKRCGKGFYVQANIGWYKGNFNNDIKNGQGLEVFYNKCAYKGMFLNGLRHQKGLYIEKDNYIYNGFWKLGIMHGKGILKTQTTIYTGSFVNWLKHGTGQQQFSNGDIYRGEYQNGRFDGNGTYFWKYNSAMYEGNFKNGLRHGKGKWSAANTKYNGTYSQGLKQGYGQLYFPSGNFYKGNFIQDKKQGYGQMFWNDGSFYKGQWRNGIQNGKGQIYTGGQIISGLFQNSILVQILPSFVQKQMELSNYNDVFSQRQQLIQHKQYPVSLPKNKHRVFSQTKSINPRKKLAKIEQSIHKKSNGMISSKMYFKSPQKTSHSKQQGRQCKCIRRLENFRLRQRKRTKLTESEVNNNNIYEY